MSRKRHLHVPYAMYHVVLRGNNRYDIFLDNQDREQFLIFLEKSIKKLAYQLHAYCLMTNHIHLAIAINMLPLGKIMQNVAHSYAFWFNRRHQRIGHVFQGRYKAIGVQDERHMLELCRYIHLNPVRANLVRSPEQYRWSSHLVYSGEQNATWLCTDLVFDILSHEQENSDKVAAYKKFISSNSDSVKHKPFLEITADGKLIYHDQLMLQLQQDLASSKHTKIELPRIIEVVCKRLSVEEKDLVATSKNQRNTLARAVIALCAQELGNVKLEELALIFGRSRAGISKSLSRLREKRSIDTSTDHTILAILEELKQEPNFVASNTS